MAAVIASSSVWLAGRTVKIRLKIKKINLLKSGGSKSFHNKKKEQEILIFVRIKENKQTFEEWLFNTELFFF